MKTFSLALLILCSSIVMASQMGCGGESKPESMTEGISASAIEEYERNQKAMEAEDVGEMDE